MGEGVAGAAVGRERRGLLVVKRAMRGLGVNGLDRATGSLKPSMESKRSNGEEG